jgi:hypothetical protein
MLTDSLPTNVMSSYGSRHSYLPQALVRLPIERRVGPGHDERVDRNPATRPYHGAVTDLAVPIVEISPSDSVQSRIVTWPGVAAEIVDAARPVSISNVGHYV